MAGELLHAVAEVEQPEMPRADLTAARAKKQLATPLEHVDAHVVEKGPGHFPGPAHADVVRGIRAGAARPVGDQQVVPTLAEDHDRRFGVDGDVNRLSLGIQTFPGLRIQLDEADVAEVGTVREPERTGRGIEKHARVDGIAVLDAIGPDDRTAVLPFVVRGVRIERLADQKADRRFWLRAGRGIVKEVLRSPTRITSGAQVLLPPRAMTSGPGRPPGSACIKVPARRHVHPSSETKMGRPAPVPYV